MKRVFATAAVVLMLVAAMGASFAVQPSLASPPSAPAAAAPDFTFAQPLNMSQTGNVHPAVVGGLSNGTVDAPYNDPTNTEVVDSFNHAFYQQFDNTSMDSSPYLVGNERMVTDSHHRPHVAWYHNFPSGRSAIFYATKDPSSATNPWTIISIPNSDTGAETNGGYKVVGIAAGPRLGPTDRIYVMWARNGVGARVSWTDTNGAIWAPYQDVPGAFNSQLTDPTIGATTGGYLFVGWFMRSPNDIFVQVLSPDGHWGAVTDVSSRPVKDQDYTPRFATAPDGGLRLLWTGFSSPSATSTDGFYREWNPTTGWSPLIVQLWSNSGGGNSRALEAVVDPAGVTHIVWDDDTGRPEKNVATYYLRGTGTTFSAPQAVFPQFGAATQRYPYVDVGPGGDGTYKVHLVANSTAGGLFDNYYTWTDDPIGPVTPVPTSTPTVGPCTPNTYSDVPPDFAFYRYIHDLSIRGAISGYSNCTFRPFNQITRAQIAKVIVIADGYGLISPPTADFTDVPYGSPFYEYVEAAYHNGIISGYDCGSPGEPCDPQHHPYFRPYANVTRAQLSKMVVLGRQWTMLNPASADFTDVAPGTAFYTVIETAYAHGIISGYNCGGPGEPCDARNRPYFRPGNTATRAQAAKIIDLAIYSNNITPTPVRTPTSTAVPTHTSTPVPPTATVTETPRPAGTATATETPQPAGTATETALPVTATVTVVLPTVTVTLPVPGTPTVTSTPLR